MNDNNDRQEVFEQKICGLHGPQYYQEKTSVEENTNYENAPKVYVIQNWGMTAPEEENWSLNSG